MLSTKQRSSERREKGPQPGRHPWLGRLGGLAVNFGLVLVSGTLALLGSLYAVDRYVEAAGGNFPRKHVHAPRPHMWERDSIVGFANKSNFEHTVFGNVTGRTNAEGFRAERSYALQKEPGTLRIFGVGDSVTWGMRVNAEDSFLGQLQAMLRSQGRRVEVINGGVVGYAAYQEYLFLQHRALPYAPDIVLVNFCYNDWLPSEDPFETIEEVYEAYFRRLSQEDLGLLDPFEESVLPLLMEEPRETVHRSLLPFVLDDGRGPEGRRFGDPEMREALRRILIEIPMLQMKGLTQERGTRLIFLFVPNTIPTPIMVSVRGELMASLEAAEIEYIDFLDDLQEDLGPYRSRSELRSVLHRALLVDSGLSGLVSALSLQTLDASRSFARLGRVRDFRRIQEDLNFVDLFGHPSRRGHEIIARRIAEYLSTGEQALP